MNKINSDTDLKSLITLFENNSDNTIRAIYTLFRRDFLFFIKKYSNNEMLNIDCYQDSIIALYENLSQKKILESNSSAKTYLFAIGKNQILNALKKQRKESDLELSEKYYTSEYQSIETDESFENKKELNLGFAKLGQKCKDILIQFYYNQYSINALMQQMNYKNENTVKAHKSRCLSKLRSILINMKENA